MSIEISIKKIIPTELANQRIDQALAALVPQHSRTRLQSWIKEGKVTLDGKTVSRPRDPVGANQLIEIHACIKESTQDLPQPIPLSIVYEDDSLIVVNKTAGLVTHPAAGNPNNTLLNGLLHHAPELATLPRAGIIHRLDKDTTGLLVIARSLEAHTKLVAKLQAHDIHRTYEAIVNGVMLAGGSVDAPIGRHRVHRTHMAVRNNGKPARTHYRIITRFRAHTHLRIQQEGIPNLICDEEGLWPDGRSQPCHDLLRQCWELV